MSLFRLLPQVAALAFLAGAAACRPEPPVTAPSGEQSVFAEAYPERLAQVRAAFNEQEKRAQGSLAALRTPPSGLKESERPIARALYERADRAGRSGYYADEALHQEALDELFEDGRAGLRRRVAGSVAYAVKQKKCGEQDCSEELANELGNAAAYAADRSLDRQQEQRLDAHSEAAHYLEAHTQELGARTLDALSKQSRALTRASFIAHVRLELYRRELASLLEEEQSARATLERDEAETRAALARSDLPKTQKPVLERRLTDLGARRAELDKELPLAKTASEDASAHIEALQKDYQAALSALLAALDQAAPEAAAGAPAAGADRNANSTGAGR
ncbi:MAG TPA: hypothetical protein VFS67_07065 [Polyangiaceae bacterium]|jgi:hypothetical protein|nr:hypothetical protein [Polyangiaceae bacterium]